MLRGRSVSRVLYRSARRQVMPAELPFRAVRRTPLAGWLTCGHHLSSLNVAIQIEQPTRRYERAALCCLALLLARFAVRCELPRSRWALTPPFHHYRVEFALLPRFRRRRLTSTRLFVFCGTICPELAVSRSSGPGSYPVPCSVEPGLSSIPKMERRRPDLPRNTLELLSQEYLFFVGLGERFVFLVIFVICLFIIFDLDDIFVIVQISLIVFFFFIVNKEICEAL